MPIPTNVACDLANLRESDARTTRADRDRAVYIADSYTGHARLVIPGSRRLARVLVVPYLRESGAEVFNVDGVLVGRRRGATGNPLPLPLDQLAETLADDLAALAVQGLSGGPAYRSLSRLALHDPKQCTEVILAAVKVAYRVVLPFRAPVAREGRPAPLTPAQRKAAKRTRDQLAEAQSVTAYLSTLDLSPGDRLDAVALFDEADEWLDAAQADFEDATRSARAFEEDLVDYRNVMRNRHRTSVDGKPGPEPERPEAPESWADLAAAEHFPPRPRTMSRQRFNQIATDHLGARRYIRGARFYVVPTDPTEEEPQCSTSQ